MRLVILIASVLAPVVARAEWVKIVETDTADTVVYIDPSSIKTRGTLKRFWDLQARNAPTADGERSRLWLREIDCQAERFRALAVISLSGEMGSGDVLGRWNLEPKWEPIVAETIVAEQSRMICTG